MKANTRDALKHGAWLIVLWIVAPLALAGVLGVMSVIVKALLP